MVHFLQVLCTDPEFPQTAELAVFVVVYGILVADFICVCMATLKLFSHSSIGKCLVEKQLKQKQVKTKKWTGNF